MLLSLEIMLNGRPELGLESNWEASKIGEVTIWVIDGIELDDLVRDSWLSFQLLPSFRYARLQRASNSPSLHFPWS